MPSNHLILCHPLSSHLQSFRVSGSFQMSQFFTSGEERIGVSALALVLPMNIQVWFPLGWTSCLRDSQESSPTPHFKSINSPVLSFLYSPTLTSIHDHWKNHSLTRWTFVGKVMFPLFNMLSRLVIAFLPRSKHLLISWQWETLFEGAPKSLQMVTEALKLEIRVPVKYWKSPEIPEIPN